MAAPPVHDEDEDIFTAGGAMDLESLPYASQSESSRMVKGLGSNGGGSGPLPPPTSSSNGRPLNGASTQSLGTAAEVPNPSSFSCMVYVFSHLSKICLQCFAGDRTKLQLSMHLGVVKRLYASLDVLECSQESDLNSPQSIHHFWP